MDVVTGCLVGIISASLTLYISGLSTKEYVFYVPEDEDPTEEKSPTSPTPSPEKIESQKIIEIESENTEEIEV